MKERKSDVEAEERNNIRKKKLFIGNLISLTIQGQKQADPDYGLYKAP